MSTCDDHPARNGASYEPEDAVNEPAPASLYVESTFNDSWSRLPFDPSSAPLTNDTLATLSGRVQALAARLDALEPKLREVRLRADTLAIISNARTASPPLSASLPQDSPLQIGAHTVSVPRTEPSSRSSTGAKSTIRRNFLSMLSSQVATMILALATVSIVPKYLGAQTFGAFSFATAFVALFTTVALLGSAQFLVKTIARDNTTLGPYVFNALVMKLTIATLLATIGIAIAHVSGYPHQTILLIEIGCLSILPAALNDVVSAALQGVERMGRLAFWTAVQQYIAGAIAIGLLLLHKGVIAYTLVLAIAGVIPLVANGYHLWPSVRGEISLDLRLWRAIAVGGMPFFLWAVVLFIYGSIDILMLQAMTNSTVVGWYNLAYRWVNIPIVLPAILVTVLFPSLSSRALVDGRHFSDSVNKAIKVVVFAGVPMAVGLALVANDVIQLVNYGSGFAQAAPLLRILAFHIPLVAMDMVLATALTAKDRQKAWLVVGCVAAVVNPILNLFAIPLASRSFHNGAMGAAIVTVVTEVVMMIGALKLRPLGVLDRGTAFFLVRCIAASLIMVPAVLLAAGQPLVVKIFIGTVSFLLGAAMLRLISIRSCQYAVRETMTMLRNRRQVHRFASAAD
jgi:O-antigen/teichoic acid export membrane protein